MVRMGRDADIKASVASCIAEGRSKREAMRCVNRYLIRTLHRTRERSPALAS